MFGDSQARSIVKVILPKALVIQITEKCRESPLTVVATVILESISHVAIRYETTVTTVVIQNISEYAFQSYGGGHSHLLTLSRSK